MWCKLLADLTYNGIFKEVIKCIEFSFDELITVIRAWIENKIDVLLSAKNHIYLIFRNVIKKFVNIKYMPVSNYRKYEDINILTLLNRAKCMNAL